MTRHTHFVTMYLNCPTHGGGGQKGQFLRDIIYKRPLTDLVAFLGFFRFEMLSNFHKVYVITAKAGCLM